MAALGLMAACGPVSDWGEPGVGEDPLAWQDARRDGLGGAELAVLVSPWEPKWGHPGRLGLVGPDGAVRFVDLDMNPGVEVGGGHGVVCGETADEPLVIDDRGARTGTASGAIGFGSGTRVREDGSCVRLGSDVVGWEQSGRSMRADLPVLVDATGVSPGAAWALGTDDPASDAPRIRLLRVDLATGRTTPAGAWPSVERREPDGRRVGAEHSPTELFWHRDRLHHLVQLGAMSDEGGSVEIRPGVRGELHLVSIDPRTGRRESTDLLDTPGADLVWGPSRGHLHDDSIFTIDRHDRILAVDVAERSLRVVGRLSDHARGAEDVAVAWDGSTLTLLLRDGAERVTREDYDLTTGELVRSRRLSGFAGVLGSDTHLASVVVTG